MRRELTRVTSSFWFGIFGRGGGKSAARCGSKCCDTKELNRTESSLQLCSRWCLSFRRLDWTNHSDSIIAHGLFSATESDSPCRDWTRGWVVSVFSARRSPLRRGGEGLWKTNSAIKSRCQLPSSQVYSGIYLHGSDDCTSDLTAFESPGETKSQA
jgi:hypothetical protein